MSKRKTPKLVDICKKLITVQYDDLEEEEKIALCNFLMVHADTCDDPGFFGSDDEYDDTGFEKVKIKQTSTDYDSDAMENTIKFIFDGYAYRFNFLSATNWEEDLSQLCEWDYSVEPAKSTNIKLSEDDTKLLKKTVEIIEKNEWDVKDLKKVMTTLGLVPENKIVKKFIDWAVKADKQFFFEYDTIEEALADFEKSQK